MAVLNPTSLPAPVQAYFSQAMLAIKVPNLIFNVTAEAIEMPANAGTKLRRRRYSTPDPAITPLGPSAVTPPPANITVTDIDADIQFYGNYVFVSDQITLQNQDPKRYGIYKSFLIDLEAYGESYGDRAQA
jgi:N4-gp56 family major capsid protein